MTEKLQLKSAHKLITQISNERTILSEITHLLKIRGIDEVENESLVSGRKRMDIFCYRRRTIIETKDTGKAKIEVLDQLEPYIRAKIQEETNHLPFGNKTEQDHPWTGIITDGRVWHVWRYENAPEVIAKPIQLNYEPKSPADLLAFLEETAFPKENLGKPRIPQNPYDLFVEDLEDLKKIHTGLRGKPRKETQTKFDLWQDMLRASGMAPENEEQARTLFVKHSFLVSIARNVSTILVSEDPEANPASVLNDGFVSWIVQDPDGEDWQKALLARINLYDWRRQKGDVLRSVYEGFISAKDRKIFGEHYTPDWLAELLVNETLDPAWLKASIKAALSDKPLKGIGVLDPACGSGTFLYHAARKILECDAMQKQYLSLSRQAEIVVKLVHGIDIHPIAAEISRATLLRALPAPPPDGAKSVRVFQGDSLMTFQEKEEENPTLLTSMRHKIKERSLTFFIPGKIFREIHIPISFCELSTFNYEMDRLIEFAKRKEIPEDILQKVPAEDREALEECYNEFAKIIIEKGNSVWAWYVINITAPAFLARRKVNRIVANPPWVKISDIQVSNRKKQMIESFKDENLWAGGKIAPHNDIAQLFVKICRRIYLTSPECPASWIVKKSALKSSQWAKFRDWHVSRVSQILDLEDPEPFGAKGSRSPIAFLEYQTQRQTPEIQALSSEKVMVIGCKDSSKKPEYFMRWLEASELLEFSKNELGMRKSQSAYKANTWRMGATLVPHVLVLLEEGTISAQNSNESKVTTKTSRHLPWKSITRQTGLVPTHWIRSICRAGDMSPFMTSSSAPKAIIPADTDGKLVLKPESNPLWKKNERIYEKHRGKGASTPKTLLGRINHQKELEIQLLVSEIQEKTIVLYPASGAIMKSTRVSPAEYIIDHSNYRQNFNSPEEAAYLVCLLNNPGLTEAFANARKSDRDFHTHVWKSIPIPRFDRRNEDHIRLSDLCIEAEKATEEWYASDPAHATYGQVKASAEIRRMLTAKGIFHRINEISMRILPDQTLPFA